MTRLETDARTVQLHGHQLSFLDTGRGPAVLFVHGLLGSNRTWAALIESIASENRVIAPDLFGHGASAKPTGDYSLSAHAATLRDLLDHLGIETVTLVGHSLGGGIAMQFSYLFPDRVAAAGAGQQRRPRPGGQPAAAVGHAARGGAGAAGDRLALGARSGQLARQLPAAGRDQGRCGRG